MYNARRDPFIDEPSRAYNYNQAQNNLSADHLDVSEKKEQEESKAGGRTRKQSQRKQARTVRQKWNQTSFPNKLNLFLALVICVATVFNVAVVWKQVSDQDKQVASIKTAIDDGIGAAKGAIEGVLRDNKTALEKSLATIHSDAQARMDLNATQSKSAMQASTAQSKAALDASIDNSRNDQRPWMGTSQAIAPPLVDNGIPVFVKVGSRSPLGMIITNSGKSPALRVQTRTGIHAYRRTQPFVPVYTKELSGAGTVFPGSRIIMNVPFPFTEGNVTTETILKALTSGEEIMYLYGEVKYMDTFDRPHRTTFCTYLAPDLTAFNACDTYNEAN